MQVGDLVKGRQKDQFGIVMYQPANYCNHWCVFWACGYSSVVHREHLEVVCK